MVAGLACLYASALAGVAASAARATFPGRDGVIAFALNNSDRDGNGEIMTVAPSGLGLRTIYSEGYGGGQLAPSYSPDGGSVAFETDGQGPLVPVPGGGDLQVMSSDGANLHAILGAPTGTTPAWGPDGNSIVYSSAGDLVTVRLDTGASTTITTGGATEPAWSTRNQIAYVYDGNIYIMPANGGPARRLSMKSGRQPTFFPSGGQIAFVRNVAQRGQIFVMRTDGSHVRQITHMARRSTSPTVSPDGRSIAFIHDDGRSENTANTDHLWIMRADGSDAHQVEHLPGSDFGLVQAEHPAWQAVTTSVSHLLIADGSSLACQAPQLLSSC
jgi:TolB protein